MNFLGDDKFVLLPGTADYPMRFTFSACTTATANDGSLPYGTTIASATILALDKDGTDITTALTDAVSVSGGLSVNVALSYPADAALGSCKVYVILTLSSGAVIPKLWEGLRIA